MAIKKKISTKEKDLAPVKSIRIKKSETAVKKTSPKKAVVKKTTVKESTVKKPAAKKTSTKKTKKTASLELLEVIVNAALDKKAENIISLDLLKLENYVCKYFIVCNANSDVQVKSIAYHIEDQVLKNLREKTWHKEGFENSQWVLLDYADVVVHIFQTPYREFYKLEELWADAVATVHN